MIRKIYDAAILTILLVPIFYTTSFFVYAQVWMAAERESSTYYVWHGRVHQFGEFAYRPFQLAPQGTVLWRLNDLAWKHCYVPE